MCVALSWYVTFPLGMDTADIPLRIMTYSSRAVRVILRFLQVNAERREL
jgi:hypothetical protein